MSRSVFQALVTAVVVVVALSAIYAHRPDPVFAVVLIQTESGGLGAGVAIGPRRILTARHVITSEQAVSVTPSGSVHTVQGRVLAKHDLAIVTVDPPVSHWLSVSCDWPQRGMAVRAYGHPLDAKWVVQRGHVSSDIPVNGMLVIDLAVHSGMSGGPLIGPSGWVRGIVIGSQAQPVEGIRTTSGIGLAVAGSPLCALIQSGNRDPERAK